MMFTRREIKVAASRDERGGVAIRVTAPSPDCGEKVYLSIYTLSNGYSIDTLVNEAVSQAIRDSIGHG